MNRRDFIRHLGIGIAAGAAVPFIPSLIPDLIGAPSTLTVNYGPWKIPNTITGFGYRSFTALTEDSIAKFRQKEEALKRDHYYTDSFVVPVVYEGKK